MIKEIIMEDTDATYYRGGYNPMNIQMWTRPRRNPDFKIKSFQDVQTFLNECLYNGRYTVYESNHEMIVIYKENEWITICYKVGDLSDVFNPMFEIPQDENIKFLFKKRKALNNYFFNDKEG